MPRPSGWSLVTGALLGGWLGSVCAQTGASAAGGKAQPGIYTCVDGRGRTLTSDRPIPDCIDREQRQLNPSGTVRRHVGPTLTAQEQAAAEARARRAAEARAREAEHRRRLQALLLRFPDSAAHDRARAEALVLVDTLTQTAEQRIVALSRERAVLNTEMEFYADDPRRAPPALLRHIEENESAVQGQRRFIAEQQRERTRVEARFDVQREQLRPLWGSAAVSRSPRAPEPLPDPP